MSYFVTPVARVRLCSPKPPFAVGVYDKRSTLKQVGVAFLTGKTLEGEAVWCLEVHGVSVPGRFVIKDGRFEPSHVTPLATDRVSSPAS
jgi:hypothetical protein